MHQAGLGKGGKMTGIKLASDSSGTPEMPGEEELLDRRAGALWEILSHLMELHT